MIRVVHPGSGFGIRIRDPGSRGSKRPRIPDPDPQHCFSGVDVDEDGEPTFDRELFNSLRDVKPLGKELLHIVQQFLQWYRAASCMFICLELNEAFSASLQCNELLLSLPVEKEKELRYAVCQRLAKGVLSPR
jgi:hypothetical protein